MLELLVVTLVIGVLAGVAVPKYNDFVSESRRGSCLNNLKTIEQSISVWETRNIRMFPSRRFHFRFQPTNGVIWDSYPKTGNARRPSGRDIADIVGDSVAFVCPELVKRYESHSNVPNDVVTSYLWAQRPNPNDMHTDDDWDHRDDFGEGEVRNAVCSAFGRPGRSNAFVEGQAYSSLPEVTGVSSSRLVYRPFHGPDGTRASLHYDRKLASGTTWYVTLAIASPEGVNNDPFLLFPKGVELTFNPEVEIDADPTGLNPQVLDILANGNTILTGAERAWTPSEPGEYVFTARGKDSNGLIHVSTPVRVRIPKPPTVVMSTSANDPTNMAVPVTVTFNVPVTGFEASDITTNADATVKSFEMVQEKQVWTFMLTPNSMSEPCELIANIAEGVAEDSVNSLNAAARQLKRTFQPIPPSLVISGPDPVRTKSGPVKFTVTYAGADSVSLPWSKLEFAKDPPHSVNWDAVNSEVTGTGTQTRTVWFKDLTGDGTCAVLVLEGTASDTAGNLAGMSNNGGYSASFTVDNTGPKGTFTYDGPKKPDGQPKPTNNANNLIVTVTFDELVQGLGIEDIQISDNKAVANVYGGAWNDFAPNYRFQLSPTEEECFINVTIPIDRCQDDVGNGNEPIPQLQLKYDRIRPKATISTTASNPTNLSPIPFKAEFDEPVFEFNNSLVYADNGTVGNIEPSVEKPNYIWTFNVTPTTPSGEIVTYLGEAVGKDEAGNYNLAAPNVSRNYNVYPKVVLAGLPGVVTQVKDISVTVNNLDANGEPISHYRYKINAENWSNPLESTTPVSQAIVRSGLPEGNYLLSVVGKTTYGIEQSLDNPTVCYWTIDATPPRIAAVSTDRDPTNTSPIIVTASFTEPVFILASDSSKLYCDGATIQNFIGTGSLYTFRIVPNDLNADALFRVEFKQGMAMDAATNWNEPHDQFTVYYKTPPFAEFTAMPETPTYNCVALFRVGGDEVVQYKYQHISPSTTGAWSDPMNVADPFILNYLKVGTHTVRAVGRDAVGNWLPTTSPDAASFSWQVKPVYVSLIAGNGSSGLRDGTWPTAMFKDIRGLTVLGSNLYISDNGVRKLDLTTGMVSTPRPGIVLDGLSLHLDASHGTSYPGNGSVWYDLSGQDCHGALMNGVGFDSVTGSMIFDGVDDRVETAVQNYGANTSWEAWFQCTESVNTYNMFMGRYLPYFGLHCGNRIIFANNIGGTQCTIYSPTNLSVGPWYHLVCTTEFNGADTKMSIYVDGVLVGTGTFPGSQVNYDFGLTVGGMHSTAGYLFKGNISIVRVYNRTLSQSEIQRNYGAHKLGTLTYYGLTSDAVGNLFATSFRSHIIRHVEESTFVASILAGKDGTAGFRDDTGTAALFRNPSGVVYSNGTLYVADCANHVIRAVSTNGTVSTLAGKNGAMGFTDGPPTVARFNNPMCITADAAGNLYVSDMGNHTIRKINASNQHVTTIAGAAGQSGHADGVGASARFSNPYGVAADSVGNVLVSDYGNKVVRKVSTNGVVSTIAGAVGVTGNTPGLGGAARFNGLFFIAREDDDSFFIADYQSYNIKKLSFLPYALLSNTPRLVTNQTGVGFPATSIAVNGGGLTGYKYTLDGDGPYERVLETAISVSGLADGNHTIELWGKGVADDWQEKATLFKWRVDTVPPELELSNLPPSGYQDTFVLINVGPKPGDEADSYQYQLDGSAWSALASISRPISLSNLEPGDHTIVVRGLDLAGNLQGNSALYSTVDFRTF